MIDWYHTIRLFAICALLSFITNFPAGVPTASLNTAIDEFRDFIHDSYVKRGWDLSPETELLIRTVILNSWYLAQFIGALTLFSLAEIYGRLGAFKISVMGMGLGNLLQFLATLSGLPELFLCGRFLAGLLSPLCDVCMVMYFQECTPVHYRGEFSFLGAMGYGICSTLGMLLGTNFMLGHSLIRLTGIQVPPVIIHLIFLFTCLPETPKYLTIVREDSQAAMKSLDFFQGRKSSNADLIKNYDHESDHIKHKHSVNLWEVLKAPHLRTTIFITIVLFILTLPFYSILQSSTFMLEQIGIDLAIAEISSLLIFIAYTIACVIGSFIIEHFPRRTLIMISGCLSLTFLSLFVLFSNTVSYYEWTKYGSLGALIGFIVTFGMVLSPIAWFISSELSIQRYRSVIYCVCFSLLNILITATNSICMLTFKQIGSLSFVPLFIIPYVFALLFLWKYLPETRDRESFEVAEVIQLMTKHRIGAKQAASMYAAQQLEVNPKQVTY